MMFVYGFLTGLLVTTAVGYVWVLIGLKDMWR